ncbi:hypothetical protein, partial [Terribacillus saccharophilus]|uniref:hypothetical protein n=1 Tax=Terribacillus saccharophilus TaxID=361277 RepID=UPI000BD6AA42
NTTTIERKRLNPIKFAIEMGVSNRDALKLFKICTEKHLFNIHLYYKCICGDHIKLDEGLDVEYECHCNDRDIFPLKEKSRIYAFFELLDHIEICSESKDIYQVDEFKDLYQRQHSDVEMGKGDLSLSYAEELGIDFKTTIIEQRERQRDSFLRSESNF